MRRKADILRRNAPGGKGGSNGHASHNSTLLPNGSTLKSSPLINQLLSTSTLPTGGGEFNVKSPPSAAVATPVTSKGHAHPHYHYTNLIPAKQQNANSTTHQGIIPPYTDFLEIPETTFAQSTKFVSVFRSSSRG